jgi:hypothetical protein
MSTEHHWSEPMDWDQPNRPPPRVYVAPDVEPVDEADDERGGMAVFAWALMAGVFALGVLTGATLFGG